MNLAIFFDELVKLGAISDEDARRSLDRLDSLEKNKPTLGQVGRYGAVGALAVPAINAVGNVIAGKSPLEGGWRGVASNAVKGGLSASAIPIARQALDRRAEVGHLKKYMQQEGVKAAEGGEPAAPKKTFSERNPNLSRWLKATGVGAGIGVAGQGMGLAAMSQANKVRPGDEALMEHLKQTASVPIERPSGPVPGGAHFSLGSAHWAGAGLGGSAGPHVKVPADWNNPAFLAHELGHADINKNRIGYAVQNPVTMLAGNHGAAAAGSLGGFASGFSDDPRVRRAGLLAPLALSAPTLAYEAGASIQGLRRLRQGGAGAGQLLQAGKALLPAWGSYAARTGGQVAGAAGAQAIGTAIHQHDKRTAKKKTAAIGAKTMLPSAGGGVPSMAAPRAPSNFAQMADPSSTMGSLNWHMYMPTAVGQSGVNMASGGRALGADAPTVPPPRGMLHPAPAAPHAAGALESGVRARVPFKGPAAFAATVRPPAAIAQGVGTAGKLLNPAGIAKKVVGGLAHA